jgi:hypothetical protein
VEGGAVADEEERGGGGEVVVLARWAWSVGGGDGLRRAGRERRAARRGRKMHVWGRGRIVMVGPTGLGCKIGKLLQQIVFWG